jgi:hypothetical protein
MSDKVALFICFLIVIGIFGVISLSQNKLNESIKTYRDERIEWITTNEKRNKQVYRGELNGVFSMEKIIAHETLFGGCSDVCFEIICFHPFIVEDNFPYSERVPIMDGAVCPLQPTKHLTQRYRDGTIVIVIHNVDVNTVDKLRDYSF